MLQNVLLKLFVRHLNQKFFPVQNIIVMWAKIGGQQYPNRRDLKVQSKFFSEDGGVLLLKKTWRGYVVTAAQG